jgi:diguanylate cyclase (GGDEF)-like protein/PAS domain S-box-containing protein
VLDTRQRIVYANPAAEALHLRPGPLSDHLAACVAQADRSGTAVQVTLDGRQIMMRTTAVVNAHGEQTGTLLLGRDVTELEQRTAELHASERLLQTLIDHLPASILVKDRQQRYMLVNTAYERMLPTITRAEVIGLTDAEVMGTLHTNGQIISSEHLPLLQQLVAQWQQEDAEVVATGRSFQQEARLPIGEHTRTYLTNKFPLFDKQDAITGIGVIAIDITARKQMEETLRTHSRAIEQSSAAIVITDRNGTIEYVNPSFTQVTGYSLAEAIGQNPRILKAGTLAPGIYRELWQHIATGQEWRGELHNRKKDGDVYWEYVSIAPVFDEHGTITHYVAVKEDITARKQMELALHERAIRDGLTGLYNRRYLDEMLPRELHRAASYRQPVGLIMLDIDHFKRYNDTYGHDAGDTLLRSVSTFLQTHTRAGDLVCRYGGEEFTLALPGASLADTQQRAEQIRAGIEAQTVAYGEHPLLQVTVSLGVAVFPDHGTTADALVRTADQALYQAKRNGRNGVVVAPQGRGGIDEHMANDLP